MNNLFILISLLSIYFGKENCLKNIDFKEFNFQFIPTIFTIKNNFNNMNEILIEDEEIIIDVNNEIPSYEKEAVVLKDLSDQFIKIKFNGYIIKCFYFSLLLSIIFCLFIVRRRKWIS